MQQKIKTCLKLWPAFTESVLNLQRTKHTITVLKLILHMFFPEKCIYSNLGYWPAKTVLKSQFDQVAVFLNIYSESDKLYLADILYGRFPLFLLFYKDMHLSKLQGPCKKNAGMSQSLSALGHVNGFSCLLGLEKETSFRLNCLDNPQYCLLSVCHPPILSSHGSLQLSVTRQTLHGQQVSTEAAVTTDHYFQSFFKL